MHDPPPEAEALARRLIEYEANGRPAVQDLVPAGERVLQRLHEELARVLGSDGFAALEARAVDLARRRYAFLGAGGGNADNGALDALSSALSGRDPLEAGDALQAVCAHIVGLLFTFLGEPLTTHFIRLAWPQLPGEDAAGRERETR